MKQIFLAVFLSSILFIHSSALTYAQGGLGGSNLFTNSGLSGPNVGNPANAFNNPAKQSFPLSPEPNNAQANWAPATFPSFPTQYLSLPGLNEAEKEILSQNYFVVINDTKIKSFTQLYNENRLDGVSSLVTADSIVHPLFALQNNIRLKVVERSLLPSLESLLISMIGNSEIDYKNTEDAETKEEIKYNLAFLTVALKLLVPDFPLPGNPGVRQLVTDEFNNFKKATLSRSVIFHRLEDFSAFKPVGFYRSTAPAQRFYSAYQWLAKSFLELSDTTSDTTLGNGNEFRRAILLFQSLMKAKIQSNNLQKIESGLIVWKQINKIVEDLNIKTSTGHIDQTYLSPENLARALTSATASETSVTALSNPIIRSRLLITIRSNAPRQFNSTSIFSLSRKESIKEKQLKFHIFVPLYSPDQDLSLSGPLFQKKNTTTFNYVPIGLLLLQNNGVIWSNRILNKNSSKLEEGILNQLTNQPTNPDEATRGPFWKIFGTLSDPWPEQTQLFCQTEHWRTFCLERQSAAWMDNFLADQIDATATPAQPKIDNASGDPPNNNKTQPANVTISSVIHKYGIGSWRTTNGFNYLEPTPDLYTKLAESQSNLENSLNQSGLFPSEYTAKSHDFIRLLKRLSSIAKLELNLDFPQAEDQALLGTIDKLLNVIETPLPAKLFIGFPAAVSQTNISNNDAESRLSGVNMEIGYPATMFAILQYKRSYYLLRGATYSYFEQCGEEINEKHWKRQVEFGFLEIPFWCQPFQRTNANQN